MATPPTRAPRSKASSPAAGTTAPPGPRIRIDIYNTLKLPTKGVRTLDEMAEEALRHYSMFVWLVTHKAPDYDDGPTDAEVAMMIADADASVSDIEKNGPASLYLALNGGYVKNPLRNQATERLILLALMSQRPQLIPDILSIFPETSDPILLNAILQPYTNSHLEEYEKSPSIVTDRGFMQAIEVIARTRMLQNIVLRDAVRARYAMISIMADPYLFGTSSLSEIQALVARIEGTIAANGSLYQPLANSIQVLKTNLSKVEGEVRRGAGITIDAVRRLRLLMGVMDASDKLFDKLISGTAATTGGIPSASRVSSVVTPPATF